MIRQFPTLKLLLTILIFLPSVGISQIQIGNTIFGENEDDQIGWAVAMSGDGSVIAVPSYRNDDAASLAGKVQVYELTGNTWTQMGNDLTGEEPGESFGFSVALSADGQRLAVGAIGFDGGTINKGRVKVFAYDGSDWKPLGNPFIGTDEYNQFGHSVTLSDDGSRLAIGIPGDPGFPVDLGRVKVYNFNGTSWIQLGDDIEGEQPGDRFGTVVDISGGGQRIAVSAPKNDSNALNAGQVNVFDYTNGNWEQTGSSINGENSNDNFGNSISLSGDGLRIAIGAFPNTNLDISRTKVLEYQGTEWNQLGENIPITPGSTLSGYSVSLDYDGSRVAVGAPVSDSSSGAPGLVDIHEFMGTWERLDLELSGDVNMDYFGFAVTLSHNGERIMIGAPLNDSVAENSGQTRVFDLVTVSLEQISSLPMIDLFPNPAFDKVQIVNNGFNIDQILVTDLFGKTLKSLAGNAGEIDLSGLPSGIYLVTVQSNQKSHSKPIIKY